MYMLDTNVCIEFLRGRLPYAYNFLSQNDPRIFKIPAIVAAELFYGAAKSRQSKRNLLQTKAFLSAFEITPFNEDCAHIYGNLRASLERKGASIGPNDLIIAASALTHNATLVTHNTREFSRIAGLRLEDWEETENMQGQNS